MIPAIILSTDVTIDDSNMRPERIQPGPGQESVWDYPRPPRIEESTGHIRVIVNNAVIADTHEAKRVLETSHPPVYYIPSRDIQMLYLMKSPLTSWCEFKGNAHYDTVVVNEKEAKNAAWYYPGPTHDFLVIKDHVAFYPGLMDACYLDDEKVKAQKGNFYGGWITGDMVVPFNGEAGTRGW
jgi:uncharacterized protein (DUF427 family)